MRPPRHFDSPLSWSLWCSSWWPKSRVTRASTFHSCVLSLFIIVTIISYAIVTWASFHHCFVQLQQPPSPLDNTAVYFSETQVKVSVQQAAPNRVSLALHVAHSSISGPRKCSGNTRKLSPRVELSRPLWSVRGKTFFLLRNQLSLVDG